MKTKAKLYFTLSLLLLPIILIAQKKKESGSSQANHRIVIQFNEADSVSQVRAVMQVENIRNIWADAQIELVCMGGGIDLLMKKNSKVSNKVADWTAKGVTFAACNNTMMVRNVKKEDLLPQAVVVPAAVIELATKQEQGWSYFRGGK